MPSTTHPPSTTHLHPDELSERRAIFDLMVARAGSQTDLAYVAGRTRQAICNWRVSNSRVPLPLLYRLAQRLRLSPRQLRPDLTETQLRRCAEMYPARSDTEASDNVR